MTLRDDLVERYSRQILLPEIGGRGQEHLLTSRAMVTGDGPAAAFAASLLAAAGVVVMCCDGPAEQLTITTGPTEAVVARMHPTAVATLVGRPCVRCVLDEAWIPPVTGDPRDAGAGYDQAVGALAAVEALRLILGLATGGRVQTLDLELGTFAGRPLAATIGCTACDEPGLRAR